MVKCLSATMGFEGEEMVVRADSGLCSVAVGIGITTGRGLGIDQISSYGRWIRR